MPLSEKQVRKADKKAKNCLFINMTDVPLEMRQMKDCVKPRSTLTPEQRSRCKALYPKISAMYPCSEQEWYDGFEKEYDPEWELLRWEMRTEAMEATIKHVSSTTRISPQKLRDQIYGDLISADDTLSACAKPEGGLDVDKARKHVNYLESLYHYWQMTKQYSDRLDAAWLNVQRKVLLVRVCGHCGTDKFDMKACGGCKEVFYCDRDCQKAGWQKHKGQCKSISEQQPKE